MGKYNKLIVWGDSLLQGIVLEEESKRYIKLSDESCVNIVASRLSIPVENYAHFGYVTEKGKRLVRRRLILDEKEGKDNSRTLAFICFGGNDIDYYWDEIAINPDIEHFSRTSPEEFRLNLVSMVEMLRDKGANPVLMNLPVIDAERYFSWFSRDFSEEGRYNVLKWLGGDVFQIYRSHEYYNGIVTSVAKDKGCVLVDVRSAFLQNRKYKELICSDGIHPNASGHKFIADVFLETIKEKVPDILA